MAYFSPPDFKVNASSRRQRGFLFLLLLRYLFFAEKLQRVHAFSINSPNEKMEEDKSPYRTANIERASFSPSLSLDVEVGPQARVKTKKRFAPTIFFHCFVFYLRYLKANIREVHPQKNRLSLSSFV